MIRLIAVAGLALAVATLAQAMTPALIFQPDGMITQVRLGCGPGRTRRVSAWPEPPSVIPAEPSDGATAGAITERKRATELGVDPLQIGRQFPLARLPDCCVMLRTFC